MISRILTWTCHTCSTPWLVDIHRGTPGVLDLLVSEGRQTLLALHSVAGLVFTEDALLLGTLGAGADLHQSSRGQGQTLVCREPGVVNLIRIYSQIIFSVIFV